MKISKSGVVKFETGLCHLKRGEVEGQKFTRKKKEYKVVICEKSGAHKLEDDGYTEPHLKIEAMAKKQKLSTYVRVNDNNEVEVNMGAYPQTKQEPHYLDITPLQNKTLGDMHSAKLELEKAKEHIKQRDLERKAKEKLDLEKQELEASKKQEEVKVEIKKEGNTNE